jgi:hypothetical protein
MITPRCAITLLGVALCVSPIGCVSKRFKSQLADEGSADHQNPRSIGTCDGVLDRKELFAPSALVAQSGQSAFKDLAVYYLCASQEYNFEGSFRRKPAVFKTFKSMQKSGMDLRGFFDFPYWEVEGKSTQKDATHKLEVLGGQFFCTGQDPSPCARVRIYVNPHDGLHYRLFRERFGEPVGATPGLLTTSFRTALLLPPDKPPFFVKLTGQVLLLSPFKALPSIEVKASVLRSRNLSASMPGLFPDHSGVLFAADFLPGPAAIFPDTDVAGFQEKNGVTPEKRIYNQHARDFPRFDRVAHGSSKVLLVAGHTLLSESFLDSGMGQLLVGHGQKAQEEWIARWVWPATIRFILESMFQNGVHFETHFQNLDFLIETDSNGQTQNVTPLMKDLGDVVEDPIIMIAQDRPLKEPVHVDGGFAEQGGKESDLADKYAGKFGLLEASERFGRPFEDPFWARSLHAELQKQFGMFTAENGWTVEELMRQKGVHARVYKPYARNELLQLVLGEMIAAMRRLILIASIERKTNWIEASTVTIGDFLQSFGKTLKPGYEKNCAVPESWVRGYEAQLKNYQYGEFALKGDPNRKVRVAISRNQDKSIQCYYIAAPVRTVAL